MPLALRPYATAGIALVGAGVIAVTPVAAPPPEIQSHSVQLTAAVDNPVDVFTPVFEKAAAFIQTTIANETANPLPIVNAVIAKGTADAQTLGEIAEALAPVVKAVILNFPRPPRLRCRRLPRVISTARCRPLCRCSSGLSSAGSSST